MEEKENEKVSFYISLSGLLKTRSQNINPSSSISRSPKSNQNTLTPSSASSTASHPLTKRNLTLFTIGNGNPRTPKNEGAQLSTPKNTPSKSGRSVASSAHDKMPLSLIFETNYIPVKSSEAVKRWPEVMEWAQSVRGGNRESVMKPTSEEKLRARRDEYEKSNEDTFIHTFMAALRKENPEVWNARNEKWERVDWDQDGLKEAWNQSFQRNSIPKVDTSNIAAKEVLDNNPRIANPKPDIVYGLSPKVFDKRLTEINKLYYGQAGICPADIWHPFCIREAKMKGTLEEAIYQCARGGAALVYSSRRLRYVAGLLDLTDPGSDITTPVFSLAVTPNVISLLVHWAEVDEGGQTWYHTSHVFTYALENPGVGKDLRHDLDNILDWGTLNRKAEVVKTLNIIADGYAKGSLRQFPTPDATESDDIVDDEHSRQLVETFLVALDRGLIEPETPTPPTHQSKRQRVK